MGSRTAKTKADAEIQELKKVFAPPSEEAEATLRKMRNWVKRGLPRATDGAFLSTRMSW